MYQKAKCIYVLIQEIFFWLSFIMAYCIKSKYKHRLLVYLFSTSFFLSFIQVLGKCSEKSINMPLLVKHTGRDCCAKTAIATWQDLGEDKWIWIVFFYMYHCLKILISSKVNMIDIIVRYVQSPLNLICPCTLNFLNQLGKGIFNTEILTCFSMHWCINF